MIGDSGAGAVDVVRGDDALTPERMTDMLRREGILRPDASVLAVRTRSNAAFNSLVVHLSLEYSSDARSDAPRHLLLKRMREGSGEREVAFYRAVPTGEPPLPRCWSAAFDPADGSSHVLLDDLSSTHAEAVARDALIAGRGVPPWSVLEGIMEAVAVFHARRWEDPRIGQRAPFEIRPWFADDASIDALIERRRRELDTLDRSAAPMALYERALTALADIWVRYLRERVGRRTALTLVHGDCYLTQWLVPRARTGPTYLVDFDSVSGAPPAFDLAFLLTTFWTSAQRARYERRCLRRYHDALLARGVETYDWEDLLLDYRVMIAFVVFDAVFDHANGSPASYWEPKMRCLTSAYQDWKCAELSDP